MVYVNLLIEIFKYGCRESSEKNMYRHEKVHKDSVNKACMSLYFPEWWGTLKIRRY